MYVLYIINEGEHIEDSLYCIFHYISVILYIIKLEK